MAIKVYKSPVRDDGELVYDIVNEVVNVTMKDRHGNVTGQDSFDFTNLPDGRAEDITTNLEINPIIEAYRENGILHLKLLNFIGPDATHEEKYPKWTVV